MKQSQVLNTGDLKELFKLLKSRQSDLLPAYRWLVTGPEIADAIFEEPVVEPTRTHLVRLVREVRKYSQRLLPLTYQLLARSELRDEALVWLQVDELLGSSGWAHPVEVLGPPRMDHAALLEGACARLRTARDEHKAALEDVVAKLERTLRIEARARRRRRERREGGET